MTDHKWRSINVTKETYDYLRKERLTRETMEGAIRRLLGLGPLDTRPTTRAYYDEDRRL